MSDDDVPEYQDRFVHCPHLLLCRSVWFDNKQPERGFSLGGIYTLIPVSEYGLPVVLHRPFVYFQIFGKPGEYYPRIRIVRYVIEGYDESELVVDEDFEPVEYPMPTARPVVIDQYSFVEEYAYPIDKLVFQDAGVYELQLWMDDFEEVSGLCRIKIGEVDT